MKKSILCLLLYTTLLPAVVAQEPLPSVVRTDLLFFRHTAIAPEKIAALLSMPPRPGDTIQASVRLYRSTENSTENDTERTQETNDSRDIRLADGANILNEKIEKLKRSGNFELLHQIAWHQPVYDPQNALRVSLVPSRRGELLKGTAQLSFERYFQLAISLLYEPGFSDATPFERESPESRTVFIHFKEVMTDNVLYYLDHPLVGVLAQITVLKTEEEDGS